MTRFRRDPEIGTGTARRGQSSPDRGHRTTTTGPPPPDHHHRTTRDIKRADHGPPHADHGPPPPDHTRTTTTGRADHVPPGERTTYHVPRITSPVAFRRPNGPRGAPSFTHRANRASCTSEPGTGRAADHKLFTFNGRAARTRAGNWGKLCPLAIFAFAGSYAQDR